MNVVTVSSKFQIAIPKSIREHLRLKPGKKIAMIEKHGMLYLIPVKPLRDMYGALPGLTSENLREEEDRI